MNGMKMTRITSYLNERLVAEHIYLGDQVRAIRRFRKEYPEHEMCVVVAEDYDPDDTKNKSHYEACVRAGCVHVW